MCFAVLTTAGCRKAVQSIHDQLTIMCLFMSGGSVTKDTHSLLIDGRYVALIACKVALLK